MSFQFQCPQGHLLEAEAEHAGQQCQCPTCGVLFVIPAPPAAPTAPAAEPQSFAPPPPAQREPAPETPFPQINTSGEGGEAGSQAPVSTEPQVYHIPCPNGHELECPADMLEQDVLCPECEVQFRLRKKDSLEDRRRREQERERKLHRSAEAWMRWSIVVAVLVVIGLIAMIATSSA